MCRYCMDGNGDAMEEMIFEEILDFGVMGDLEVDVHVYSAEKSMILDINRIHAVDDGRGIERKIIVNYCPFCGRKI